MNVKPLSQLKSRRVDWLWPNRLALGKLSMLDGDPGLGKSLLALDLCARLTTGRPFPECSDALEPANVLILNAEDSEEDTIRPRLAALGADLRRAFVLRPDDSTFGPPLRLPDQTELLERALARTRARFVVLDPIVAFLDATVCDSSNRGVRRALGPLGRLAEDHRCTVQLIRHLNKRGRGQSLYRGVGSIGFLGACRSGWLVARDPEDPSRRVLAQVKNNLAPPQPSLLFTLESTTGPHPHLTWLGQSPFSADDLLRHESAAAPQGPRDLAADFLTEFLRSGPRTSRDLWPAARERRLSKRTLYRARRELHIRVERIETDCGRLNYWLLPDQVLPPGLVPPEADLEPWLAPLRAKYPPSTPLDDL